MRPARTVRGKPLERRLWASPTRVRPRIKWRWPVKSLNGCRRISALFLFVNISALHQPNCFYLPGANEDTPETQAAALAYVDRCLPPLFAAMRGVRPSLAIICSDHGTAYGEDGYWAIASAIPSSGRFPTPNLFCRRKSIMSDLNHMLARNALSCPIPTRIRTRPHIGRSEAGPVARCLGRGGPRRAVSVPAHSLLRDALRLLQSVHDRQPEQASLEPQYLDALERQARQVREALGDASISRAWRSAAERRPIWTRPGLDMLFDIAERRVRRGLGRDSHFGGDFAADIGPGAR